MPRVSVLMVFHRDTPFLRPAIESVRRQTFRDWELVLVDNGTGLPAGALGEAGRDPRLTWVRLPRNEGIPGGHNAGVAAARGEFIALLDYDDLALPGRLERQVGLLERDRSAGLVSSLAESIDEQGRVMGGEFALVDAEAQRAYVAFAAPVVTPAYTGRRALFERFPYRAELSHAADFDFLARAIEAAGARAVPEVLLHYRRHAAQTTGVNAAIIEEQRAAIRLLAARRRRGDPEDFAGVVGRLGARRTPAGHLVRGGVQFLAEGHAELAAHAARRAFALGGGARAAALGLALRTLLQSRGEDRSRAARLLRLGPVRALGLRPAYGAASEDRSPP